MIYLKNSTVERVNDMATATVTLTWISDSKQEAEGSYAHIYCQTTATKDIENADRYTFDVRRYKDNATKEEYLNVKVYENNSNDVCAEIEKTNIIELERELLNLRIYGVMLGRKHFPKIRQLIEKAYPDLTPRPVNESTQLTTNIISSIYVMFVRYIREVGIEADKNGLYNIPVDEFKEYLIDTDYSKYKYSDIRAGLAKFTVTVNGKDIKGTKCSYGRNDNTIAKGDKRIKVISFVAEVVDSYQITELPEG